MVVAPPFVVVVVVLVVGLVPLVAGRRPRAGVGVHHPCWLGILRAAVVVPPPRDLPRVPPLPINLLPKNSEAVVPPVWLPGVVADGLFVVGTAAVVAAAGTTLGRVQPILAAVVSFARIAKVVWSVPVVSILRQRSVTTMPVTTKTSRKWHNCLPKVPKQSRATTVRVS